MKKILIISFSKISTDPRVMRQIRLLENLCELTVIGFGSKHDIRANFIEVNYKNTFPDKVKRAFKLILGLHEKTYWSQTHIRESLVILDTHKFDLIIANDLSALPLALKIAKQGKVLFDAHEYSPREGEEKMLWRLTHGKFNEHLCATYLKMVDAMLTVSDGISDEYLTKYGVISKVVYNAPKYQNITPSKTAETSIRIIHHGAAIRSRNIEAMIEMMDFLDHRYTLDLMLVETNFAYLNELKKMAAKNSRINFVEAVPMEIIAQSINNYDIGVYILPPVNFNHVHALPNKFFEFVQARLAIAIGPSLEMKEIVKKYQIGIVAKSFLAYDLAQELNNLNWNDIDRFKSASNNAAFVLSSELGEKKILESVEELIGSL